MNWFAHRRRDYILWRLATVGEVRRNDIAKTFGVDMTTASTDINALLSDPLCGAVASYDKSSKRYVSRRHQPPARLAAIAEALGWD